MRCYICNKEIVDNPINDKQCRAHGEHIIHNGIRGKLISKTILCEECGGKYSKDDAAFCKIFAPFIAALGNQMIPADHGKDKPKILLGSLFDTPTSKEDDPSRPVRIEDGVVTPLNPYYEIDGNKITVYAEKHRINHYINELSNRLKSEGKDINHFTIEKVTDLHDKGYLAYFFSKDNASFNEDFKKGIVKIATEYALECGVPREQLKNVLQINNDGTATFDCSKTKMFPFIPTSLFDIVFEDLRYRFEDGYPSHTLKLFTTTYKDSSKVLFCYLDLFSTFQYYVMLNEDYDGEDILSTYAQRLIPEEKPDVSGYDPSDLDIVIREYGIDMEPCSTLSYAELLKYVQNYIRKLPPQTYDFQATLNRACERIQTIATAVLGKQNMAGKSDEIITKMLETICPEKVIKQAEKSILELTKQMSYIEALQLVHSFSVLITPEYYRKMGVDIDNGDVFSFSIPDESMKFHAKHKEAAQIYTRAKFSHLCCLCYSPSQL